MGVNFFYGKRADFIFLRCGNALALNDPIELKAIMDEACRIAQATIVETVMRKFEPVGLTLVNVLAESDLTAHTFPKNEEGKAIIVSIFTCGCTADPEAPIEFLKKALKPQRTLRTDLTIFDPNNSAWREI